MSPEKGPFYTTLKGNFIFQPSNFGLISLFSGALALRCSCIAVSLSKKNTSIRGKILPKTSAFDLLRLETRKTRGLVLLKPSKQGCFWMPQVFYQIPRVTRVTLPTNFEGRLPSCKMDDDIRSFNGNLTKKVVHSLSHNHGKSGKWFPPITVVEK